MRNRILVSICVCLLFFLNGEAIGQKRYKKLKSIQLTSSSVVHFQSVFLRHLHVSAEGKLTANDGYTMFADLETLSVIIGETNDVKDLVANNSPFIGPLDNTAPSSPTSGQDSKDKKDGDGTPYVELPGGKGGMSCSGCKGCLVSTEKLGSGETALICSGCTESSGGKENGCISIVLVDDSAIDYCLTSQNHIIHLN